MKRRLLAAVLCVVMAAQLAMVAPQETFAKERELVGTPELDPEGKYYTSFTIDKDKYKDIGGGAAQTVDKTYIYQLVKDNLLEDWAYIAESVFCEETKYSFLNSNWDKKQDSYNTAFREIGDREGHKCYGNVREGLIGKKGRDGNRSDDYYGVTGLCVASSLNEVRERVARELNYGVNMNSCKQRYFLDWLDKGKINALPELNDTTETFAVYSIVTPIRNRFYANTYYSYGICFYDFQLDPIYAKDLEYITPASKYSGSVEKAFEMGAPGISIDTSGTTSTVEADIKNTSTLPNTFSVTSGSTVSHSTATIFSRTTGIKYTNTIGAKLNLSIGGEGVTGGGEISYAWARESSESETESSKHVETGSVNNSVTSSVSLPAHTAMAVKTTDGERIIDMNFDTPVELKYKVAIFSTCGDMYADDGATCCFNTARYEQKYFLAMFGVGDDGCEGSAARDLAIRTTKTTTVDPVTKKNVDGGYPEATNPTMYGFIHRYHIQHGTSMETKNHTNKNGGSGINWDNILSDDTYKKAIENMRVLPMISSGGSVHTTINGKTIEVNAILPLYCLNEVELANKEDKVKTISLSHSMNVTDTVDLIGYDKDKIPYYGFDQKDGEWYLCNYAGYELDDEDDPGIINIYTDYFGDCFVEGTKSGEAYIRWRLKDGVKYTGEAEPGKEVTKYTSINTPVVKIVVDKYSGGINVQNRPVKVTREDVKNSEVRVNPISVVGAQGELSYKRISGDDEISLNTATGEVIVAEDTKPGKYTMKVKVTDLGTDKSVRAEGETDVSITVSKNEQQLEVSDEVIVIDYSQTKLGNVTTDPIEVFGARGTKSYIKKSQTSVNSKLRIDETTGRITALKGIAQGDYDLIVEVSAAETTDYKSGKITRTIPITVVDLSKSNAPANN